MRIELYRFCDQKSESITRIPKYSLDFYLVEFENVVGRMCL